MTPFVHFGIPLVQDVFEKDHTALDVMILVPVTLLALIMVALVPRVKTRDLVTEVTFVLLILPPLTQHILFRGATCHSGKWK